MGGNILDERDKYSLLLTVSLRKTAAFTALMIIAYAIAANYNLVATSTLINPYSSIGIGGIAFAAAYWMNTYPEDTRKRTIQLFLIPFHIVAVLSPTLITGFMSPLTILCSVLVAVTGILVSRIAMWFSALLVVFTAVIGIAIAPHLTVAVVASHLVYAGIVVYISLFTYKIYTIQFAEHNAYIKEKDERATEQLQLSLLINSVNEAIISINAKGYIQFYNAATLNLLDTNQTLSGKKLDHVLATYAEDNKPVHLFDLLRKNGPTIQRDDLTHRFANGESIDLAISSSRIRNNDNAPQGYILIIRDITRDKSFDEERDEFISVVSHELRTPVAITEGTLSNVQLLLEKGAAPSVVAESLAVAYEQTLYLSRMINDLSTLSRAERGVGSAKEKIDVTELMHGLYNEYQKKVTNKHLKLNLDIAPQLGSINVSRLYLEEILQNLITNAIKYTQKGSITLSAKHHSGQMIFAIRDTGIGISKPEQKKVFDKFYRSEDYRTRETNGTGLGLYIVRKLANKIGTEVMIDSQLNHGSTFSLALPDPDREIDK